MRNPLVKLWALLSLFLALALAAAAAPPAGSPAEPAQPRVGEAFPNLSITTLFTPDDYALLGMPGHSGPVSLNDIPGDFLYLEFFNRFCISCQRQVVATQAFVEAMKGTDLEKRVKILGIASGSTAEPLATFRKENKLSFPMALDPVFDAYYSLGDLGGMPFSFYLAKQNGRWVILDTHLGTQGALELMARIRVLLEGRQGEITRYARATPDSRAVTYDIPDAEQLEAARTVLSNAAQREVTVRLASEKGNRKIFEAIGPDGQPLGLYAIVAQRLPICDLCHTIVFAVAYDKKGVIASFLPLYLTKFGNETWNESDVRFLSKRLLGKNSGDLDFHPDVDAVTSATMSTTLIFDEAKKAGIAVKTFAEGK